MTLDSDEESSRSHCSDFETENDDLDDTVMTQLFTSLQL